MTGTSKLAAGVFLLLALGATGLAAAEPEVPSVNTVGRLVFNSRSDGTNYNYRVEWAPSPGGPWSAFDGACYWLDAIRAPAGHSATSSVPMCYRVVATRGEYLVIDLSGGTGAVSYAVTYYPALADVPGGPANEEYKTTKLLMRLIPKGVYTMGSPTNELGRAVNEVQHQLTLTRDFYMGVFEVTQKQWERVRGNWPGYFTNVTSRDSRPVNKVSYYDIRENPANSAITPDWPQSGQVHADSFVGKLRSKTGLQTLDLPTEAQWEYACQAGTTTALNSGKNLTDTNSSPNLGEVARYFYTGGDVYSPDSPPSQGTAMVGSYLPNLWGLYDMHGNVWEWCLDWQGPYSGSAQDPVGSDTGAGRVIRGGAWNSKALYCRSSYRGTYSVTFRFYDTGFRLALTLP